MTSLVLTALALGATSYSQAAVVSDEAGLRAAITTKDSAITIPAGATITLTQPLPTINYDTTITGAFDGSSVIDGAGAYPAFDVTLGANVTIQGLTVQNSRLTGAARKGGAAVSNAGNLTVSECHFLNNVVDVAGVNTTAALGGALFSNGTLSLQNSSFFNNTALGASGRVTPQGNLAPTVAAGGAVYIEGTGNVLNCTFSGNLAKGGDGVGKDPKIASSAGAHSYGGALSVDSGATATLGFLTIINNEAKGGNTEISSGGGTTGGGIGFGGAISSGSTKTTIQNNIFSGSKETSGTVVLPASSSMKPDVDGDFTDGGGNLFNSAASVVKPMTKALNGTQVFPIDKSSPAYNQAVVVASVIRDQRGISRPRAAVGTGTGFDIGAYQLGVWTVTADSKVRPYNTVNPALTYTVRDPYLNIVSVSGNADISTTAITSSPVGSYPITVSQGTLDPANDYVFVGATLTVTPVPLIVTADDKSRPYNTDNPALTYVITNTSGAPVAVSGSAALSTTAVKTSPAGGYPISVAQGTLDSNYTYTFVPGTLTVTRPALTVTADDKARPYNTANPTLTYVVRDGGGSVVAVSGTAALSTTAVTTSPVGAYPIAVTQGTLDNNYTYTFVNGTLTVVPASLIVTADDKSRPYNTANPTLTYTVKNGSGAEVAVSGTAALSTTAVTTSPVGNYPITVSQGTLETNYTYTFIPGTLTVTRPALTVTADDKTRAYNTANPALTYTVKDGSGTVVAVSGTAALSTTAVTTSPVGSYPISVSQGTLDNNYTYTFVPGTLTVVPAGLIVSADNKSRLYNTDNPPLTYVITDSFGTVVAVSGAPALSTTAVKTSPVGSYSISVAQGSLDNNYSYTFIPGTLTVTPAPLTVTADDKSRPYNTANPTLTYVVRDSGGKVVTVSGAAALSTTAVTTSPVGTYPITVTQGTLDSNYSYTFVNGTLTVTPAALIVTADNKSRLYNTPNPALTYTVTDSSGKAVAVSGAADISTTAVTTSPVGSYPITVAQGTLETNYTYTFRPGTLTVTRPALKVTADDKTRAYNTDNPALTYTVTDSTGAIFPVPGTAALSTTAVKSSPVGSYPISVSQGTLDNNYTYTFVPGTLTVTPATLIVSADNKSRLYNTDNPALTYKITDSVGTVVAVSGTPALSTTAVKSSPVGSYPITVTQGSLENNYTYTFIPGTLTVTQPALTVTADDKSRPYNTANPTLTYVVRNSGGAVVAVSGTAAISTTAVTTSPVGTYPITVSQGTLDSNYSYTFVNGTLTVTPAALIVTADNKSRLYNTPNPALTYTVTDSSGKAVAVSGSAAISTTAVTTSPVGSYPITVAQGTLETNYTYTFRPGTLTVTRPALTVKADDKSRLYNTDNPTLTYVVTDSTGTVFPVSGTAAISTTAVKTSAVGDYPISVAQGTLDNNYSYTYVPGKLTVTQPALTVTADNKSRLYNTDNPTLTYVVTDSVGAVVSVSGTAALSTTAVKTSPVGSYPITVTQGSLDKNYSYTFIPGTLTITKGSLIVTADDKSRLYNTDNPTLTYVVKDSTGKVVNVSGAASLSTIAVKTTPVGTYPIVPTQGTLDNNYTYAFVNGTLTITQPALTVIADNQTRPYNTPNPALTYVVKDSSGNTVSVSGSASVTTTAIISSPVGDYPITPTQGTLDSNYTYTFKPGTLKITRSALKVVADDKSRPYNTANPPLTYTITDSSGSVVGVSGSADITTTAVTTSNAGDYPITVRQGTLDPNYTYTYVNGKLTVTPIGVAVALPGSERYYGQRNAEAVSDLTSTNVNWTRNDLVFYYGGAWVPFSTFASAFSGDPQFKTDAVDYTAKVGSYNVIVYTGSLKSQNVTITNAVSSQILTENKNNSLDPLTASLGDYLRVLPVDLHITAYADPPVAPIGVTPTYKYYYGITNAVTGKREGFFVNNETEGNLISRPRSRLKDLFVDLSIPGIYTLTPYGAQSENYNIIRHDGSFAVYNDRWSLEEGPLPRNYEKTGLFEQLVLVKNDSTNNWVGLELNVAQVDGGTVVNANRTTPDGYCLLHNYPVVPGEVVAFVVEYQIPAGNSLWYYPEYTFTPLFAGINDRTEVRTIASGSAKPITSRITVVDVPTYNSEDWTFDTAPATPAGLRYLVKYGWAAWVNVGILLTVDDVTVSKTYEIQFSDDNVTWTPVVPRVKATSKTLVWTDKGAPKTPVHPLVGGAPARFYRVVEMP